MLDAGAKFDRSTFWTHVQPWEWRERTAKGEKPPQFFLDTKEQPYLTPPDKPFELIRVWGHGGKTNVWGRVSLRYSDLDFKGAAKDGWEIPWPISYADVAPYYDKVEQLIGVCGGTDDSDALPGSKFLQPAPPPRCGERLLQQAFGKVNIPIVAGRRANMTQADARLPGVPLLRQLRAGLRHRVFLQLGRPSAAVCAEDRPSRAAVERRRRARAGRRPRACGGRAVLRSEDGQGAARLRQGRRDGRERRGHDAHPAELEVREASERARERQRRDRAIPVRADSRARARLPAAAVRDAGTQRPRHRRRAHLHAPVHAPSQGSRVHPRVPDAVLEHRLASRRTFRHSPAGFRGSAPTSSAT